MLQMDFSFFDVDSILGFTLTFVAVCSDTSHPFVFPYRIKLPPLDILKFIVDKLINQYKKFAFIRFDEDGSLARSSEFMKTCHNKNIVVQNIGVDASSLSGKSKIIKNKLYNITRALLLNSSYKK